MLDNVKGHYALKNQLEKSSTSIGANIREAKYAQSKADFISKLQIALKSAKYRTSNNNINNIQNFNNHNSNEGTISNEDTNNY